MEPRNLKRTIVVSIFLALFSLVVFSFFFFFGADPSCSDGKKNQGEEGIDCGGPCKSCRGEFEGAKELEVTSVELVYDRENFYDAVLKIKNSNKDVGASFFTVDVSTERAGQKNDSKGAYKGFILPNEEKEVIIFGLFLEGEPEKITATIDNDIRWARFQGFEKPDFVVNNSRYEENSGGQAGFSRVTGVLINQSSTDFEEVIVSTVLRGPGGELLAVNSQEMNTFRTGEAREFVINFPRRFPGSVTKVKVDAQTNVFDDENYIRTYGQPERWDRSY